MNTYTGLKNDMGQSVALKSVHLDGRLDGLLLSMKIRQSYFNDSDETIEASYTFPAGWGSNLLSFSVELNGKRMQAIALEKQKAEKDYEKAIEDGDTPVMIEKSPLGLYTANLGNLKAGESAVIEIEFAQLLRFESGRLRITVPTVIGERYGDAQTQGHIAQHQSVDVDHLVEYPFTARLDVLGAAAKGAISCSSHDADLLEMDGGQRIELTKGGLLDRDFVVLIDELEGASFALAATDDDEYAVVASFCPKFPEQVSKPLALKILVDCSGSMQGESISQAQEAVYELSFTLGPDDAISYSKFGSTVVHTSKGLERCSPNYLKNVLARAIFETHANLGGTELQAALTSTFNLSSTVASTRGCDLLLITDGDIWDIEEVVAKAKQSNHRIFAIGVGSAPAESLLRELAEQTGGSCELVTPSESIAESVMRMTKRMRSSRTSAMRIDWGQEVVWQSAMPKQVFSEETVHVFAKLKTKPQAMPVLSWSVDEKDFTASPSSVELQSTNTVARLTAGVRLQAANDESEATQLALKYQLASKYTNLLLVHVRAEEDKAQGLPSLQKISQMQAAGWGGFGQVDTSAASGRMRFGKNAPSYNAMSAPPVWRSCRSSTTPSFDMKSSGGMDDFDIPAFLRRTDIDDISEDIQFVSNQLEEDNFTPEMLIEMFNQLAVTTTKFSDITGELTVEVSSQHIWKVLGELTKDDGHVDHLDFYWACLIDWVSKQDSGIVPLNRHSQRLLNAELAKVERAEQEKAEKAFRQAYPKIARSTWGMAEKQEKLTLLERFKRVIQRS
jgi:Ca-activated chloride channel homolog